jgi:sigma-B regulation protein RsbU (phosphoserine phosphatase)
MFTSSLTTRLVLLLTVCIAVTLLFTTAVEYGFSRAEILRQVESKVQANIDNVVNDIEVRLGGIEAAAQLFAEVLEQRRYSEAELIAMLREAVDERKDIYGAALALNPDFSSDSRRGFASYFYYLENGQLGFTDLAATYDYPARDWFREPRARQQPGWGEPYFDEGAGNVLMATYSVPMYHVVDGQRKFYGVVTADISLQTLQRYLSRISLGERGFGFLVSRAGLIMAGPNPERVMQPLLDVLPESQDPSLWRKLLADTTAGKSSSTTLACQEEPGNCILKLAPLRSSHWPVGTFYSEYEMLAPLREHLLGVIVSGGLTLLLLLVVVSWVARRITRPLTALASASAEIATGNFHSALPAVRNRDELGRLIQAFSLMQQNLQHHVEQLQQETASRNRMEGELAAATEIQMSMLPQGGTAFLSDLNFNLWVALQPAKSVGGDLYYFQRLDAQRLMIVVGDVSDKGVPAALFMARAMVLLQQVATEDANRVANSDGGVAEAMAGINAELVAGNDNCMFVTLFLGMLDLDKLELVFASAGHNAPYLLRENCCRELQQTRGPALGLAADLEFPTNRVQLQPRDQLAIFTDGIDEAFNASGEQYGFERFSALLQDKGDLDTPILGQAIFNALAEYADPAPQSDDIALMLLRLPAAKQHFPIAGGKLTSRVLSWLQAEGRTLGIDNTTLWELQLVTEEAVTNIINYAQLPADAGIDISLDYPRENARSLCLTLTDCGLAFNPLTEAQRAPLGQDSISAAPGGLGVHLMESLTDWQEYLRQDNYNVLRLGIQLPMEQGG